MNILRKHQKNATLIAEEMPEAVCMADLVLTDGIIIDAAHLGTLRRFSNKMLSASNSQWVALKDTVAAGGQTLLYAACFDTCLPEEVEFLLDAGANPNIVSGDDGGDFGRLPHQALVQRWCNHLRGKRKLAKPDIFASNICAIIELLAAAGVNMQYRGADGLTALQELACSRIPEATVLGSHLVHVLRSNIPLSKSILCTPCSTNMVFSHLIAS